MKKIQIFVTLGPASINKKFLTFINNKKISLVRLNMSHVSLNKLKQNISFIRKYCNIPICIDTEGAQVRTKTSLSKKFYIKKNQIVKIYKNKGKLMLYPEETFYQLKSKDFLSIGFENLELQILKKENNHLKLKCIKPGYYENNKGVHLLNRKINLNFLTKKDFKAIEIGKKMKINNYALSFTNTLQDLNNFRKLLPKANKIYKIETKTSLKNLSNFFKIEKNFLIDRGDLSKDIGIENIPIVQRAIFKKGNKVKKTRIFIATNFLESMINQPFPTRAEVNDIFNALEMGASGLVLAGETAIGNYPAECIVLLKKIIKAFQNKNQYKI